MMLLASSLFKLMEFLSILFIFGGGPHCYCLLAIVFAPDRRQTRDAILRNYPVIGHMRHVLPKLGEFLRQYFFAMDRDELSFNRAERNWVENSSKNADLSRSQPYRRSRCSRSNSLKAPSPAREAFFPG
jgi:hypothetical protein